MDPATAAHPPATDPASQAREKRAAAFLRLLIAAYIGFNVGKHWIARPFLIHGVDYEKHWLAVQAVLKGASTYEGEVLWLGFNYPQWSALATLWLAFFPVGAGEIAWKTFGFLGLVASWRIAWLYFRPLGWPAGERELAGKPRLAPLARGIEAHWLLAAALLVTLYSPAGASSLFVGNIDFFNAFLVMAMFGALFSGRERLGGVYWAMLCLVKMMPAVLILPVILWRRWKLMQGWFGFMVAYFWVLVFLGRLGYEWFFVREMAPLIPHHWRGISMSPVKFYLINAYPDRWEEPEIFNRAVAISTVIFLALYGFTCVLIRLRGWSFERALEGAILFVPLMSPLMEDHHTAWALPIFIMHVGRFLRGQMEGRWAALYFAGWSLLCMEFFITELLQFIKWSYYAPLLALAFLIVGVWGEAIFGKREFDEPRIGEAPAAEPAPAAGSAGRTSLESA